MTVEFIKHIEYNIKKLDEKTKNLIRKDTITVLNGIDYNISNNKFDNIIKQGIRELKKFLKNNKCLLVTKADKGNSTVIISYEEYVSNRYIIIKFIFIRLFSKKMRYFYLKYRIKRKFLRF